MNIYIMCNIEKDKKEKKFRKIELRITADSEKEKRIQASYRQ